MSVRAGDRVSTCAHTRSISMFIAFDPHKNESHAFKCAQCDSLLHKQWANAFHCSNVVAVFPLLSFLVHLTFPLHLLLTLYSFIFFLLREFSCLINTHVHVLIPVYSILCHLIAIIVHSLLHYHLLFFSYSFLLFLCVCCVSEHSLFLVTATD